MKAIDRVLATFFGLGLVPLAPGTVASAAAAALYLLFLHDLAWPLYVLLVAALFLSGTAASARYALALGRPDPGRVVIDEVCGQLIALAFLPAGWTAAAVSFAFFRIFDIAKPWPIRRLEKLPGGWGIMADDVGAGLVAAVLSRLVLLVV
ncbi:MAG TPA: phosphatidylglycerophosphatase A [Candidatus Aminicenantes bacterium]|nr:phosphatidylglycerophosphatase A [Candidatus Aminicenantes bacterium]HRY65209.1 phosphatidylglycerophosphatase A [Candidatus Aminicenantes bacterium]HRZ72323.1 phosphatidylglycerophosphatase A [Candidatus Aminicenantes bacterium]